LIIILNSLNPLDLDYDDLEYLTELLNQNIQEYDDPEKILDNMELNIENRVHEHDLKSLENPFAFFAEDGYLYMLEKEHFDMIIEGEEDEIERFSTYYRFSYQEKEIERLEGSQKLTDQVIEAFDDLAEQQRGIPERVMNRAQQYIGGGVYSNSIEHVGDLTHRMAKGFHLTNQNAGFGYVYEKIIGQTQLIDQTDMFEKEMYSNFENNFKQKEIDYSEFLEEIRSISQQYADAHEQLPVFNELQYHAKHAAVSLGEFRLYDSAKHLEILRDVLMRGSDVWYYYATEYELDNAGNPIRID
jgi:hypothetical protein